MPVVTPRLGLAYLALVKQVAQNTPAVPSTANGGKFMVLVNQSFVPTQNINELRTGNARDIQFAVKNNFVFTGSFQTYLFADEGAALLAWLFGNDAKTGASDPYTHTLTFSEPLPYLTCEVSWYQSNLIERVMDCKIGKIELDFTARKEVMLTVHILGCSVAVQTTPLTPAFSNVVSGQGEGPMRHADSVFTITGPSDGPIIAQEIQKLVLTIDQGCVDQGGPGQVTPIAIVEEGRKISFKGTAMFTSDALQRLVFYGSSSGLGVAGQPASGSLSISATSVFASPGPERSIALYLAQHFWTLSKPMFDQNGKTGMMDFEATAYRAGNTLPLTAVAKNGYALSYTA